MMTEEFKLDIRNISKTYGNGVRALDEVSLTINKGMFGLLGPNGAGKSTLMRSIATLQAVDKGTMALGEIDVLKDHDSIRRILGYLPQDFGVYANVSAHNLLSHFATLKGITDRRQRNETVDRLLHKTNLWNVRKKKLGSFSGGMKQRFGVAQALIGDPRLIIVDEPTAGLDPEERNRFLNLLSEIGENVIVILSTHIVEDVSEVCNSMAIISEGRVLRTGSPAETIAELEGKIWKMAVERGDLPALRDKFRIVGERLSAGKTYIHVYSDQSPGDEFEQSSADLRDVYFTTLRQVN
ncbi:MAG: ABC transporter ATP-binding protein [Bacteroidales bacterium]|nr:ABC transporter ATP-binding protein [Candidatus Latescibacterota bacterium]